jgi:hypothetical protein
MGDSAYTHRSCKRPVCLARSGDDRVWLWKRRLLPKTVRAASTIAPRPVDYFVATIRCNLVQRPTITEMVWQGHSLLANRTWSAGWCIDMKPCAFANTYQKPIAMPAGTHLTMQFLVHSGSYTVGSAITPFSAH